MNEILTSMLYIPMMSDRPKRPGFYPKGEDVSENFVVIFYRPDDSKKNYIKPRPGARGDHTSNRDKAQFFHTKEEAERAAQLYIGDWQKGWEEANRSTSPAGISILAVQVKNDVVEDILSS